MLLPSLKDMQREEQKKRLKAEISRIMNRCQRVNKKTEEKIQTLKSKIDFEIKKNDNFNSVLGILMDLEDSDPKYTETLFE